LTIYIALVRILHSAELNQIAGALEIPAKAIYDHRFSRWFFFGSHYFSSKDRVISPNCAPDICRSTKKEKMSNMKIQVNNCSHSIKLILPLYVRAIYRLSNCSLLSLEVMRKLKDGKL